MSDQQISEISEKVNDIKLTVAKLESHLESELGNNTRHLDNLSSEIKKINHKLFGNGSAGLIIEMDRLKQAQKTQNNYLKAFAGVFFAVAAKIAYDLVKLI